jgi:hypothetical protein
MKNLNQKLALTATSGLLATIPNFAAALDTAVSPIDPTGDLSIGAVLTTIITWVLGFSAAVAVLFLIIGGLQYITASGNDKRAEAAKQTLMYAVIGLVVILLSFVIVGFIKTNLPSAVQ